MDFLSRPAAQSLKTGELSSEIIFNKEAVKKWVFCCCLGTKSQMWDLIESTDSTLFFFSRKEGYLLVEGAQRTPSYGACDHSDGVVDIEAGIARGL